MQKLKVLSDKGFTLIEIAIVMVIIGLLAGGGVSLMGMLSERKIRNESAEYLDEAKAALISYAKIYGRLPLADTNNDGLGDSSTLPGTLPYLDLVGLKPKDANGRVIGYALNSKLGTSRSNSCSALRSGLAGFPLVVDADGSATAFPVAAVLIGAGPKDADNDNNVFDDVTAGTHRGDNRDGAPNYLRHPPDNNFDDLVVYISGYSLYGEICGDPVLTIHNSSTTNSAFVYNVTQRSDLGEVKKQEAESYSVISGEKFELWTAAGRSGSLITSEFIVSGAGTLLDVSP
jgi:prepilin-type N-terminal cleavage/methylation domain-containing protein